MIPPVEGRNREGSPPLSPERFSDSISPNPLVLSLTKIMRAESARRLLRVDHFRKIREFAGALAGLKISPAWYLRYRSVFSPIARAVVRSRDLSLLRFIRRNRFTIIQEMFLFSSKLFQPCSSLLLWPSHCYSRASLKLCRHRHLSYSKARSLRRVNVVL